MAIYNDQYLSNDKDVIVYNDNYNKSKNTYVNSISSPFSNNPIGYSPVMYNNNLFSNSFTTFESPVYIRYNNKNYNIGQIISTCNFLLIEKIKDWLAMYCNIHDPSVIIIEYINFDLLI